MRQKVLCGPRVCQSLKHSHPCEAKKNKQFPHMFHLKKPTNPYMTEHLAFQLMCANVHHVCQLPSVFVPLLAAIFSTWAEFPSQVQEHECLGRDRASSPHSLHRLCSSFLQLCHKLLSVWGNAYWFVQPHCLCLYLPWDMEAGQISDPSSFPGCLQLFLTSALCNSFPFVGRCWFGLDQDFSWIGVSPGPQ